MDERHTRNEHEAPAVPMSRWAQNRFLVVIFGAIAASIVLVSISLALYFSSGTAPLDLSRPDFKSVRSQIKPEDTFDEFPSTGSVDASTLKDFKQQYDKRAKSATSVDAFGGDVLDDQTLGIDEPPANQ